jgi:hypothetical protein
MLGRVQSGGDADASNLPGNIDNGATTAQVSHHSDGSRENEESASIHGHQVRSNRCIECFAALRSCLNLWHRKRARPTAPAHPAPEEQPAAAAEAQGALTTGQTLESDPLGERFHHQPSPADELAGTMAPPDEDYDAHAASFIRLSPQEQARLLPRMELQWRHRIFGRLNEPERAALAAVRAERFETFVQQIKDDAGNTSNTCHTLALNVAPIQQPDEFSLLSDSSSQAALTLLLQSGVPPENIGESLRVLPGSSSEPARITVMSQDLREACIQLAADLTYQQRIRSHPKNEDWHLFVDVDDGCPLALYVEFSRDGNIASVIHPGRLDCMLQQNRQLDPFYFRWQQSGRIAEIAGMNVFLNDRLYLDPADPDAAYRVMEEAYSKIGFTQEEIGEELGHGVEKSVHPLIAHPDLCIAKFKPEWIAMENPYDSSLDRQVRTLNMLDELRYPVVKNHGIVPVDSGHAILMDRVHDAESSNALLEEVANNGGSLPFCKNMDETSLAALKAFRQKLIDDGLHIQDIQLLFDKDKKMHLIDPGPVVAAEGGNPDDLELIDTLIAIAEHSIRVAQLQSHPATQK